MPSFSEIINSDTPVLVDFSAEWCGPCKAMTPILKEVAAKIGDKAKVLKVNVDKNQKTALKYRVQGVPTLLIFKNGDIQWRHSGVIPANQIVQNINQFL